MSLFKSIFLNELVLVVRVLLNHSYFVGNPWQRLVTFNNRMILTKGTHVDSVSSRIDIEAASTYNVIIQMSK